MKILIGLTYYRPHYSGLTIYVERLAKAMAKLGHHVIILTSRYDRSLPRHELIDGVEVFRLEARLRVSKGLIMPGHWWWATHFIRQVDVINLHLPQLDAATAAVTARALGKPVVVTYHCDLKLPKGIVHRIANVVSTLANHVSAGQANVIVTNTADYAEHSPFLKRYLHKIQVVPPPIEVVEVSEADLEAFRQKYAIGSDQKIIGMAARLATEKGVEYLVGAMPAVLGRYPQVRVIFVGQYQDVMGEESYAHRLAPLIEQLGEHWTFSGVLAPLEFSALLHLADVTVLPSINSTESFGMVQVESMICGTPVVASNLPGVRQAVNSTGMGCLVPARDSRALTEAILAVLDQPERFRGDIPAIRTRFAPETIAAQYEAIFERLIKGDSIG